VAAATAASSLVHLWLVLGNQHGLWLNLLMLVMVAVCLPCAVHIWREGRVSSLHQVMACALAMTALHAYLLLGTASGSGSHAHGHGLSGVPTEAGSSAGGLLAVLVLELTTALLAATLLARLRRR
jgi:hypothetical protein